MSRTVDILATLGARKPAGQLLVGFAAESEDVETYARQKLAKKNLDCIFANDIGGTELGFGSESNRLIMFTREGERVDFGVESKQALAERIVQTLAARLAL